MASRSDWKATETLATPTPPAPEQARQAPRVRWDETEAKTSFPTVCSVESTRGHITLSFGLTQPWTPGQAGFPVQLTDRIVLSPASAKRLALVLVKTVQAHEARARAGAAPL